MAAYMIVDTKLTDRNKYEEYKSLAKPVVESFGGEYLARGGSLYVDQNELWSPTRLVVVKFPSMEHAKKFLNSDIYKPIKELRLNASKATLTVVDGL